MVLCVRWVKERVRTMDGNLPPMMPEALGDRQALRSGTSERLFDQIKRGCDMGGALLALPLVGCVALILLLLNPIWNRGPLFFVQTRMGRDCTPFQAYKFRTMRCTSRIERGPNDPLETDRITRLGALLRKARIDEMPQFFNVLRGEMSIIGPRPDYWDHALHYAETVPGYRERYSVRPGITGLAQVDGGYAEGVDATRMKTRYDLRYIERASYGMDFYVLRRTVVVVFTGLGAR